MSLSEQMVQAELTILPLPEFLSQNMPRCRARDIQQHCRAHMPSNLMSTNRPCPVGLLCCIILGVAGCAPQAAATIQQLSGQAPQLFSLSQQDVLLQQIIPKQELQSSSLPMLGFSQEQRVQVDKALLGKQQQQQQQLAGVTMRRILQYKPSPREQEASKKDAGHMSVWNVLSITLLCLLAMAALGVIGYHAMQWYERSKRPGYVELQAVDSAYHRPWVSL